MWQQKQKNKSLILMAVARNSVNFFLKDQKKSESDIKLSLRCLAHHSYF